MGWKAGLLRCNSARPELGQAKHGQHAECWKRSWVRGGWAGLRGSERPGMGENLLLQALL